PWPPRPAHQGDRARSCRRRRRGPYPGCARRGRCHHVTWVLDNLDLVLSLAAVHLRQSAVAIVLGFLLALPLGWLAWRFRLLRGPLVLGTGLLYTIPSLALLILMPAALGYSAISETNLVAALVIYAVAILVRSVVDGDRKSTRLNSSHVKS